MANARFYSSTAQQTSLSNSITSTATSITVGSTTGFPTSFPYTLALDYGSSSEELVDVTSASGLTLNVNRAVDGTAGSVHSAGAVVKHVASARDFTDLQTHIASSQAVHGLQAGSSVVGTTDMQTLTNKTLTSPTLTAATIQANSLTVGSVGSDVTQFILKRGTDSGATQNLATFQNAPGNNTLLAVGSNGQITISPDSNGVTPFTVSAPSGASYLASLNTNGVNKFLVSGDGGTTITNSTVSTTPLSISAPSGQTGSLVAATVNGAARFVVGPDGGTTVSNGTASTVPLSIQAPSGQTGSLISAQVNGNNRLVVGSDGNLIVSNGATATVPLQITAPTGQSGDLINASVGSTLNVFRVDKSGNITGANASFSGIGNVQYAVATSDQSVSNTTLTNDNALSVNLAANATYDIELMWYFVANSSTAPDVATQWAVGSMTFSTLAARRCYGPSPSNGATLDPTQNNYISDTVNFFNTTAKYQTFASSNFIVVVERFVGTTSSAGTINFQFAQFASEPTAVTRKAGSWVKCTRIG